MEQFYRNEYRDQLEDLFIDDDYETLNNEKALELLLLFTMPLQEALPVSKALIEHFGSFSAVINAGYDEIIEVGGMDRDSAVLVSLAGNLVNRTVIENANKTKALVSHEDAEEYFKALLRYRRGKRLMCAALDGNMNILDCKELVKNSPRFDIKTAALVADFAKKSNSESVVVAYNQKAPAECPDKEALEFAAELKTVLKIIDVSLDDVIAVSRDDAFAFSKDLRFAVYL